MRSVLTTNLRYFSAGYNYSAASNPRVFMDISRDGNAAGRMVFELYENHTPNLATNFAAFCTGAAPRSFPGTRLTNAIAGFGVSGGRLSSGNWGAKSERVPDENLLLRHHKRGILTMRNNGPHSNGSNFQILFGEAH